MPSSLARYLAAVGRAARPPAPRPQILDLFETLGHAVEPSVAAVYAALGGTRETGPLALRLLTPAEAIQDTLGVRRHVGEREDAPYGCFWNHDSDYAVVFLAGPLAGMVGLLDHEEPIPVPAFGSVAAFLDLLVSAGPEADWSELARELPRLGRRPMVAGVRELVLRDAWVERWRSAPDDTFAGLTALQLVTRHDVALLRELMRADDMWIQERACNLAGIFALEELAAELEHAALHGGPNAPVAALRALQALASPPARAALARVKKGLGPSYATYFRPAR